MNILNFSLWLFLIDIINTFFIQMFFVLMIKILDNKLFLNIISIKRHIIKFMVISNLVISIILRLMLTFFSNNNQVSLIGTVLLILFFCTTLIYFKLKIKNITKNNVLKLFISFISTLILNLLIEIICTFVLATSFNISSSDILYNLKNTLLFSVPMRIIQLFLIFALLKTNKQILKNLILKNLILVCILLFLSISDIYIFIINNKYIDSLSTIWKYYFTLSLIATIATMLYLFIWASKKNISKSLSNTDKLSFLLGIMDNLELVTNNITDTHLLQNTLLEILNSFISPSYMYCINSEFDIVYSTYPFFEKEKLQRKINNNKNFIRKIYTERKYYVGKSPLSFKDIKSSMYIPLYINKNLYGLIVLEHKDSNYFEEDIINLIIKQLENIMKNSIFQNKIKESANYDYLTKIYNREFFNETLEQIKKTNSKVSIMMLDIDFFKKINDKYGHYAGDEVLKKVASQINSCIRSEDILARYGGEEFIICFNNTNPDYLLEIGERIRKKIEKNKIVYNNRIMNVTISIGIACPVKKSDIDILLLNADKALYESKKTGRNKCTIIT